MSFIVSENWTLIGADKARVLQRKFLVSPQSLDIQSWETATAKRSQYCVEAANDDDLRVRSP